MTKGSLKSTATKGMLWNALEKLSVQGSQLIIGIVLARILMPEDFGLIGMLTIFIVVSQVFIGSGMGSGLIQKKNRTEVDYSTVFVFNFAVSSSFYILLFLVAPLIANFYNMPQLVGLTRVLAINIVINSLAIVQRTRLIINIDFKTIAKVNVVSVIAGGLSGVTFAYLGFGVWALVIQNLVRATVSVIMFWLLSKWKFSLSFSKQSFKELFGFGYKLLLTGLYGQILQNIYKLIIGKAFSAAELGFYTQAKNFAELASGTVSSVLQQVTYPILASLQDDKKRMTSVFSRMIRMTAFLSFPAMTMLALLADPFIRLVLTEKWLSAVPLLQWLSFARIFYPISALNLNMLNANGRSDLYLKVDASKIPLIIIALIVTVPFGVKAMVIGQVVTSAIAFFINAYMPGKLFGYGPLSQLKDMIPVFIATAITALVVFVVNSYIEILIIKLIAGVITGLFVYLSSSYVLKIKELKEVRLIVQNILNKK